MTWSVADCRSLAEELLSPLTSRWMHVQAVAGTAAHWLGSGLVSEAVVRAAWLHDIGYSEPLAKTGMHAIDGARYLNLHGVDGEVVSLVAHHTGAWIEAEERHLTDELVVFDLPYEENLEALTLADLATGTSGQRVTLDERFEDIFTRYEPQHPVHRAVTRSRDQLTKTALRAASRLGYPM